MAWKTQGHLTTPHSTTPHQSHWLHTQHQNSFAAAADTGDEAKRYFLGYSLPSPSPQNLGRGSEIENENCTQMHNKTKNPQEKKTKNNYKTKKKHTDKINPAFTEQEAGNHPHICQYRQANRSSRPHPVSAQLPCLSHPGCAGVEVMDRASSPPPPPAPLLAPSIGHKGVMSWGTAWVSLTVCRCLPHRRSPDGSIHLTAITTGISPPFLTALGRVDPQEHCRPALGTEDTQLLLVSACAYTVPSSERCAYSTTYMAGMQQMGARGLLMLWYPARAPDRPYKSQAGGGSRVMCPNDPASGKGALEAPAQGSLCPSLMDSCAGKE